MTLIETPRSATDVDRVAPTIQPPPRRRGHRLGLATIATGVLVAASSLLWSAAAVPALVKYPTDLDVTLDYAGTFRLFADPNTFAPLDEPLEAPLTIERRLQADANASGTSHVVVDEAIEQHAGSLLEATQHNVYVMDRRDMVNVADERAFSFEPGNVVDRSGSFRLQLPLDTDSNGTYTMYINETDSTYGLVGSGSAYDREGLSLSTYTVDAPFAPLSDAYLIEIRKSVDLPESLTFDQMRPYLQRAGLDVDDLIARLTPVVTGEDLEALVAATAEPIRLDYVLSSAGSVGIDRMTGTEVDVASVRQTLAAMPDPDQIEPLRALLAKYADVPAIAEAADVLAGLGSNPIALAEYDYRQTSASVADIADDVKDQRQQIRLAETIVPVGLVALGAVLVAVGVVLWVLPPRRSTTD